MDQSNHVNVTCPLLPTTLLNIRRLFLKATPSSISSDTMKQHILDFNLKILKCHWQHGTSQWTSVCSLVHRSHWWSRNQLLGKELLREYVRSYHSVIAITINFGIMSNFRDLQIKTRSLPLQMSHMFSNLSMSYLKPWLKNNNKR